MGSSLIGSGGGIVLRTHQKASPAELCRHEGLVHTTLPCDSDRRRRKSAFGISSLARYQEQQHKTPEAATPNTVPSSKSILCVCARSELCACADVLEQSCVCSKMSCVCSKMSCVCQNELCMLEQSCVCSNRAVYARTELCMLEQSCVCSNRAVYARTELCVLEQSCVKSNRAVCARTELC